MFGNYRPGSSWLPKTNILTVASEIEKSQFKVFVEKSVLIDFVN